MSVDQVSSKKPPRRSDDAKLVRYEDFIDSKIESTRRTVKLVDLATSLVELTSCVLAFLLVVAVVEHWLVPDGFNLAERATLFALLLGGTGYFAVRRLWPLVARAINPVFAAHAIEQGSPTLKNSLINLLLFREQRKEIPDAVYRTLEEQAAQRLTRVPVETAVDRTTLIRFGYLLIAVVAATCLYKVFSPKDPWVSAERVLMPWADIVPASRVVIRDVTPGSVTVSRGEFVDASAEVHGVGDDDQVLLRYTTDDGQVVGKPIPMKPAGDGQHYVCRIADEADGPQQVGLTRNITYRLEAGDARSLDYTINVVTAPSILVERVDYDYPAYTGYLDRSVSGLGDIRAIEGTKITIRAKANGPIRVADVDFDADGRPDLRMSVTGAEARAEFALGLREDRQTPQHASYVLRFTNEDSRTNRDPVKHAINVERDQDPEAAILLPKEKSIDVRPDDKVSIEVEARDPDFGLSAVRLCGESVGHSVLEETLLKGAQRGRFTARYTFVPSAHGLKSGDTVQYWVEAADSRTPKPNTATTERKTMRIGSPDPNQQPPPDQVARNDRQQPQPGEKQQGEKQNGDQQDNKDGGGGAGENGKADKQQGGGQKQSGDGKQPQNGEQQQGGGKDGDSKNENGQQGGGKSKSGNDGKKNAQGSEKNGNESKPGEQAQPGDQSKPDQGSADGQNSKDKQTGAGAAGSQSSKDTAQPDGTRPDQNKDSKSNGQPNDSQQANGSQQKGENQTKPGSEKSPVSSDGDNDGEAFDRIQKHMERSGDIKKDDEKVSRDAQRSAEQPEGEKGRGGEGEQAKADAPKDQTQEKGTSAGSQNGSPNKKPNAKPGETDQQKQPGEQSQNKSDGPGAKTRDENQPDTKEQPGEKSDQQKSPGGEQTASKGPAGGGDEKQNQGSPNSQPGMKPTDKHQQSGSKKETNKEEPPTGGRGKRESDATGDEGGDKPGGGEEGGGQKSPRDGTGSAGQHSAADEGKGESGEKGKGNTSTDGGQDTKSDKKTGSSSENTKGEGSKQQDGTGNKPGGKSGDQNTAPKKEDGSANEKGENQNGEKPAGNNGPPKNDQGQPNKDTTKQGEQDKAKAGEPNKDKQGKSDPAANNNNKDNKQGSNQQSGSGQPGNGGDPGSEVNPDPSIKGSAPEGDAANLEYARKQTDLVLGKLADQVNKNKVDDRLLKELGWSRDDLKRFVQRWQQRKDAAQRDDPSGEAARRELDDALRSLGLRRDALQQAAANKDSMRDLKEGYRGPVPLEYQERLRVYNEGVSRAKQAGE